MNKAELNPKKIYLQADPENEKPKDFENLEGITWCADKINNNDIEYIRADVMQQYADEQMEKEAVAYGGHLIESHIYKKVPMKYSEWKSKEEKK